MTNNIWRQNATWDLGQTRLCRGPKAPNGMLNNNEMLVKQQMPLLHTASCQSNTQGTQHTLNPKVPRGCSASGAKQASRTNAVNGWQAQNRSPSLRNYY